MNTMIIESDPRTRDFLSRALRAEGHQTAVFAHAALAQGLQRDAEFDAVLFDPSGGPGRRACAELRQQHPHAAIVVITACDDVDEKIHALRNGADDYLTKPFNLDELLARMEAIGRRRRRTQSPAPPRVGDLEMNAEARTVQCGRQTMELTRKEFDLLQLLVQSNARVVSRERILNQVWGYSADPLTNVVDVYIARLRRKLAAATDQLSIRTVHGVGYRIQATRPEAAMDHERAQFAV